MRRLPRMVVASRSIHSGRSAMDLPAALVQRRRHRLGTGDWAQRCLACDQAWPCPTWRTARAVVLLNVRRSFASGIVRPMSIDGDPHGDAQAPSTVLDLGATQVFVAQEDGCLVLHVGDGDAAISFTSGSASA